MTRDEIRKYIAGALDEVRKAGALPEFDAPAFSVEAPEDPSRGDFATNAAFALAKLVKKKPLDVAQTLAEVMKEKKFELIADVTVAAPGFINFTLSDDFISQTLAAVLDKPEKWGRSDIGAGKTVRVEYFQLNIAKRPHIGHLRSAVIGDAIKRMLLACGYHAVSDTHVGDWGTQFGILLYAIKQLKPDVSGYMEDDPLSRYEMLYSFYSQAPQDPALVERLKSQGWGRDTTDWQNIHEHGKEEFAKLERGDSENREMWKRIVDASMRKLKESASRLGLYTFDMHRGESFYESIMPEIVALALEKGVAKKLPDGAVIVDLTDEGLDEAVLTKADGASTYLLRDLATIKYMKETLNFSENIYVVDVRQSHHFKQVFRVAELLGFEGVRESRHVEFGFMALPEGPLSTRRGTAISLDALLFEAGTRASKVIKEKNPNLKDRDLVAEDIGLGAIKYFDLSHHRKSDIVFRWEDALNFEGNSGPYLQYTYARLKSILRNADQRGLLRGSALINDVQFDEVEHRLLAAILRLPEAIEDSLKDYTPNTLANYLYNLAKLANEFYHSHPVMQEANEGKRNFRIALVQGVTLTLAKGLNLLGIAAPEEM